MNHPKLVKAAEIEGFETVEAMLEDAVLDSIVTGICKRKNCDYTTEVEPDQTAGWCEECGMPTVQSVLIIAGLI